MAVHLDEGETAIGLETRLHDVAKIGKQRDEVVLRGVRGEVAHVAGGLPGRSLADDHVVAVDAVGGEVMVAVRGRWSHAHGLHGLLLGDGGLAFLVGPVAADGTRTEPFAVHGAQRFLSLRAVAERHEAITSRATSLHVPHDASLGHRAKGRESLQEDLVVDLVGQIANENVEVVGRVLFARRVGLIGPVDADFLFAGQHLVPSSSLACGVMRTSWWTRRPFSVCMARSAAPGSSYSTKP